MDPKTEDAQTTEQKMSRFGNQTLTSEEELSIALQSYIPDTDEEKKLVRKIDFVLLPCLWWM